MIKLTRHIPFLKAVLWLSLTAFGGPLGHMGMMVRTFVNKRKDVTEQELLEYNAFAQLLPGPSSTQTILLIAWKRGGILLAIIALLIWLLPATIIMTLFALLITHVDANLVPSHLFLYIQPMTVGFVFYAAFRMLKAHSINQVTIGIVLVTTVITIFYNSPWVFPVLILLAGILTNFSKQRITQRVGQPKKIKWINLWLFVGVFALLGILSELARQQQWETRRLFNLSENFYRFGSIVFGGGQMLLPLMLVQFVTTLPTKRGVDSLLSSSELLTGFGLVQAIPGPVFSVCAFVGGLAMREYGVAGQWLGSVLAVIMVNLPGVFLVFFFYPVYQHLKQHVIIYRALEGILAAIIGFIFASGIILFRVHSFENGVWMDLLVAGITFALLQYTKIPAPIIVLSWLLLGWSLNI